MRREIIYHCPACGGPHDQSVSGSCKYCAAPRVPLGSPNPRMALVCSGCKNMVGEAASFCSSCGEAIATIPTQRTELQCPACEGGAEPMTRYGLAPSTSQPTGYAIDGCKHCGGVWVDVATLEKMYQEAAPQASLFPVDERSVPRRVVLGVTAPLAYRRCPACQELMTRRNFQRVSGVMLDACSDHGTFFDMGELHDVLNFVRRGGLVLSQQKRATQERAFSMDDVRINEALKHLKQERAPTQIDGDPSHALYEAPPHGDIMMSLGELTLSLLRWGTGWAKRLRAQLAGRPQD